MDRMIKGAIRKLSSMERARNIQHRSGPPQGSSAASRNAGTL
jgi:hypothetical protein